ncbi:MAG: zinc ribbon domain-containing protein [Candidatus Izemoplasmatales bacterium]|jgi:hypothetical protein|nr:zinc ribbon domain-containing protein [Candidatus Izemoplasmatales bacterium]MDD4069514.1 zinc ribbon domain-containing protein [Candidatus Izemoplasmatales bacterium]MDY0138804.1 zinc ribbon domain-containing protein [Candidatus Izemoplasmatales bacterium]
MAYCKNCGAEIHDEAVICPHCGVPQKPLQTTTSNSSDTGGFGWGLLGFCIPLVGLILYLVWKDEQPNNSKAVGKGALIGVIVSTIIAIFYVFIIIELLEGSAGDYYI